jgi:hypothetical protein
VAGAAGSGARHCAAPNAGVPGTLTFHDGNSTRSIERSRGTWPCRPMCARSLPRWSSRCRTPKPDLIDHLGRDTVANLKIHQGH